MQVQVKNKNIKLVSVLTIVVISLYYIYLPGLSGGFLFDDIVNLNQIKYFSQNTGFDSIKEYILSNPSGLLKRPISMFSFLLNSTTVPVSAYWFKFTNLLIHAINVIIIFFIYYKLLKITLANHKTLLITTIVGCCLWAFHPYLVSSILYSVQRMTILSAMFVLFGILLYIKGRELVEEKNNKGFYFIYISVFVFTPLATLSKENGILLPFYLYLMEIVIINRYMTSKLNRYTKFILFYIPIIVVLFSLLIKFPNFLTSYESRDFDMGERLLTQARIMVYYLYNLFVPKYFTEGVFADVFIVSKSIFHPISTIYSIVLLLLLLILSIFFRKKYPLSSFGVLFYFTAHFIESTFIPLELYFEHRIYIPSMFISIILSSILINKINKEKLLYIIPIAVIGFLMFNTYLKTNIWRSNFILITQSAIKFPHSVRAVNSAATEYAKLKLNSSAESILLKGLKLNDSIALKANLYALKVQIGTLTSADLSQFKKDLIEFEFRVEDGIPFFNFIKYLIKTRYFKNNLNFASQYINEIELKVNKSNNFVLSRIKLTRLLLKLSMNEFVGVDSEIKEITQVAKDFYIYDELFNVLDTLIIANKLQLSRKVLNVIIFSVKATDKEKYFFLINKSVNKYQHKLKVLSYND